jgi:hypothetical protein
MSPFPLRKIVSGGQTGVDRGALDAALARGFPCGGWCPAGRIAEDGRIPLFYPLSELASGGYIERTIKNVADSDGTAIIYFGELDGGTAQTLVHCKKRRKPYQLVNAADIDEPHAASLIAKFVATNHVTTLNVAGPRQSKAPLAHSYAYNTVTQLLSSICNAAPNGS